MSPNKCCFAGVFDSPTGEVKEMFANQPGRPKPLVDLGAPLPLAELIIEARARNRDNGRTGVRDHFGWLD